ncbi:hypothetical protein [Sinimarinibacterium flocculans]|uniref:hypothetical protein n=1 Tax=Sinimarinibacterium flocculans TaxID=985250 RepID=UPI003518353A
MSTCIPTCEHDATVAAWVDLIDGQTYKLRVRAWEQHNGQKSRSDLGTIDFSYGIYDKQFKDGGGVQAAFVGVLVTMKTRSKLSNIHIAAAGQSDLHVSLELLAGNNRAICSPFLFVAMHNEVTNPVLLKTRYCRGSQQ